MTRTFHPIALIALLAPSLGTVASAQTASAMPQHTHYDTPPGYTEPAGPGQSPAPRLQNSGVHTFPVSTTVERTQLFMNQGLNLTYRDTRRADDRRRADRAYAGAMARMAGGRRARRGRGRLLGRLAADGRERLVAPWPGEGARDAGQER